MPGTLEMGSYLIMPVQRTPRYLILLEVRAQTSNRQAPQRFVCLCAFVCVRLAPKYVAHS